MKYIYILMKRYRHQFMLMSIISAISGSSGAVFLALVNYSITSEGQANNYLIYGFITTILIILLTQYVQKYYFAKVSNKIVKQLRIDISDKILSSSLRCKEELGDAELLTLLTQDIQALSLFLNNLPVMISALVLFFAIVIYIGVVSGLMTCLLILAFVGSGAVATLLVFFRTKFLFEHLRQKEALIMSHFRDLIMGFKELKLNFNHNLIGLHIKNTANNLMQLSISTEIKQAVALNWGYGSIYVLSMVLIFAYPLWITVSPEIILSNILSVIYLITPIQIMMMLFPLLNKANVSAQRLAQVEQELKSERELFLAHNISDVQGFDKVVLSNVFFGYTSTDKAKSEDERCLGPFNLSFKKHEIVFFIGGNGSGKSTLLKILCGLYQPQQGQVYWNGDVVDNHRLTQYRQQFATVFSDFHLYSAVDLYNVDTLLQSDLAEKCGRANLLNSFALDDILAKEKPILVDALSCGQKKRLAILIAILQPKPVCLFDEPAAELDPDFKRYFYMELLPKLRRIGKTLIIVSHDDNYFDQADRLVHLRDGGIVQDAELSFANVSV